MFFQLAKRIFLSARPTTRSVEKAELSDKVPIDEAIQKSLKMQNKPVTPRSCCRHATADEKHMDKLKSGFEVQMTVVFTHHCRKPKTFRTDFRPVENNLSPFAASVHLLSG